MTDRDRSGDGPASDPDEDSTKDPGGGPASDRGDAPGTGDTAGGDRGDPTGDGIPFEETLRPRYLIRLFGSDQLRYRVDERGLAVAYEDLGADPSSSLAVPAAAIDGASVVWDRETGYQPRENPRRTLVLVRWLYYWMPYSDPVDALVEVRTDDGPELFGTARPAAFQAAVGTILGLDRSDAGSGIDAADASGADGSGIDDDPDRDDGRTDDAEESDDGSEPGQVGESTGSPGGR